MDLSICVPNVQGQNLTVFWQAINRAHRCLKYFLFIGRNIQGVFFNWPPLNMSLDWPPPQKCLDWPPLNLVSMRITLRSSDTQTFFDHGGGPVWDSNIFLKSVTYRPTLSKFRGGPVKKTTLQFCLYTYIHSRKTNTFTFFPQAYMENFEKCAKRKRKKHFISLHCPKNS